MTPSIKIFSRSNFILIVRKETFEFKLTFAGENFSFGFS